MSQQTLNPPTSKLSGTMSETTNSTWASDTDYDEFGYTPVSPWGPVALVLGIASLTAFTGIFGIGLAAIGVVVGIAAVVRIHSSAEVVKGKGFALGGALLSVACLGLGSYQQVHLFQNECPPGYQRVNFPNEISKREFVYYNGVRRIHPEVGPLIGTQVYLKGYMWQTRMTDGLKEFVFLKDNGECCFGGEPKPYDMMVVKMADGLTTKALPNTLVAVAGVLNANVNAGEGEPVYTVEARLVERAPTMF